MYDTNMNNLLNISWFIITTVGNTTGILLANTSIDILVNDTYYVIAHFHLALSLGTLISLQLTIQHNQ